MRCTEFMLDATIMSDFVDEWLGEELSGDVVGDVRAVDPGRLATRLRATGLGDFEVGTAVARLREVQDRGAIVREVWRSQRRELWTGPADQFPETAFGDPEDDGYDE